MNHTLKILFVLMLFSFIKTSMLAQAPTNGLVAYYPFTGNANDASGNNRNGTIEGGVSLTVDRLGNSNQAYAFNGSNGDIITSYANWQILTGNAARTISVWFKTTLPSSSQYMVSWGSLDTNLGSYVGTNMIPNNDTRFLGFFATNVNSTALAGSSQYYDNRWHLLTFTHDGSTISLYLDGVLQTSSSNVTLNTSSSYLAIGRFTTGPYYFSGSLDEVRIYNRALTATEVQQMYTAEVATSTTVDVIKIGPDKFIHATGSENTFVGLKSGAFSSGGTSNTFMGFNTAISNTGSYNTLVGTKAGFTNTTGNKNTFVGYQSGNVNTTGANNTFIGIKAGASNTTGSNNIIIGPSSGTNVTTGSDNVLMGYNTRAGDGRGRHNIIIGDEAGGGLWAGTNNTLIGHKTSADAPNLQNATAIGANAHVTVSNAIVLGANANVGIGTSSPTVRLEVVGEINNTSGLRLTHLTAASVPTQLTDQFLTVNEKGDVVKARYQLRINNANEWSDKVFAPTYQLRSLNSVESFIQQNGHLPNVPSAEQVVREGLDLVKLNAALLEKIEELTLYSIQLEKTSQQQSKQLNQQNQLLQQLELRLQALEKK